MKKNICFIIDHLGVGGVQEYLLNYVKFSSSNTNFTIVSIFGSDIYSTRLRAAGANVVFLTGRPYNYGTVVDPRTFWAFLTFYRRNHEVFDFIHLKLFAAFAYASLLMLWRLPNVSAGIDCNRSQLPFPIRALFWIFGRHYKRFYMNRIIWNDYKGYGFRSDRLRDQPNPITRRQSDTPKRFSARHAFLSVGRGIAQKGHAEAVAFFNVLKPMLDNDACLIIVGDGPAIDELKVQTAARSETGVLFAGSVADYDDWLMGSSGLIRMAFGEDTNSVMRECLLAGKIVASTLEGPNSVELAEQQVIVPIDRENLQDSAKRFANEVRAFSANRAMRLSQYAERRWPQADVFKVYD
ncbi:glycosyltransferase [Bosea lathyri]|uniref:Glycosyltransferase involved in cell wall bisynthesis n=1 Tax=Bosea lathyri TaxID=1036778 RepID=A0A1H6D5D0_9HYPH|nr:glycosyltransferase [Bosea lathyri]SEG80254.1 Glycosyltransferase involved in cell wall bisynthesis [Bosea lathyri]